MLNEKILLEEVKDHLVNNLCSLRHTFKRDGVLVARDEVVLFQSGEARPEFITYIPEEYENTKIDMRIRKRLAIEFINTYSLDQLKQEYFNVCENRQKQEDLQLEEYAKIIQLAEVLKDTLSKFTEVRPCRWTTGSQIVCEFRYNDYTHRQESKRQEIEIRITGEGYTINHKYSDSYTCKNDLYSFNSLQEMQEYINDTLYPLLDKVKAEADSRLQELYAEQERENKVYNILKQIRMSDNWYVLKSKRTYTAISGDTKFSLTSAVGKYVKPNYRNILNDIMDGKIEGFAEVENGIRPSKIDFKALQYTAF